MEHKPVTLEDLYTVEDLAKEYPNILGVQTLRWQLRSRDTNGLAHCCIKVGKKLLISKSRYEQWLSNQSSN